MYLTEHKEQSRRLNEQTIDESAKGKLNKYCLKIIERVPKESTEIKLASHLPEVVKCQLYSHHPRPQPG